MHRHILYAVLGFAAFAVLGYIGVASVVFLAWELIGVKDRDGGGSMAVAYVFAPTCAAIAGAIGATLAVRYAIRHPSQHSTAEGARRDRRILAILVGCVAGLIVGWQAASFVQVLLRPAIFDSRIIFKAFELAHRVLVPLGILAGGWFAFRWTKRQRPDVT